MKYSTECPFFLNNDFRLLERLMFGICTTGGGAVAALELLSCPFKQRHLCEQFGHLTEKLSGAYWHTTILTTLISYHRDRCYQKNGVGKMRSIVDFPD